jgi:hypothetical protein
MDTPKKPTREKVIHVRVLAALLARLESEANEMEIPVSALVRKILARHYQ